MTESIQHELPDGIIPPTPGIECETHIASGTRVQPRRLVVHTSLESADRAYARGEWISMSIEHTVRIEQ